MGAGFKTGSKLISDEFEMVGLTPEIKIDFKAPTFYSKDIRQICSFIANPMSTKAEPLNTSISGASANHKESFEFSFFIIYLFCSDVSETRILCKYK